MHQISVRNIKKSWGAFSALKNISLDVREGEFLSILGPSGCGKSTLLRIIAGLEAPTSGDIVIAGRNVTRIPVWQRKIGFVFQNFALWPHLTAYRNVSMGLELLKSAKHLLHDRVLEALRLVQLDSLAHRLPSQLSGGQQQRVALARAIVLKPEVLLLDEPLSALDKTLRQEMQVELKSLQQTLKLTTIFVTHDQEEALSLSDRVVVMNKGAIEQIDTPNAIYNQPVSEYVARFVGEAFFFKGHIERHDNSHALRLDDGSGMVIELSDELAGELASEDKDRLAGQEAVAFVRPEWVELSAPDPLAGSPTPHTPVPQGKIERLMFFGQSSDYLVRFGERQLRVKRRANQPEFAPGDTVAIRCIARILPGSGVKPQEGETP